MGLTIHYTAQLRTLEQLPQLVAEVQDICQSLEWKYELADFPPEMIAAAHLPLEEGGDPIPITLKGIIAYPPKAEPLWLLFTPSGRTSSPLHLMSAEDFAKIDRDFKAAADEMTPEEAEYFATSAGLVYSIHLKTQYAGVDMHIALVKLLKYLEKKYFHPMRVTDEGDYWETGDEQRLRELFGEYKQAIATVRGMLEEEGFKVSQQPISLRIDELLRGDDD